MRQAYTCFFFFFFDRLFLEHRHMPQTYPKHTDALALEPVANSPRKYCYRKSFLAVVLTVAASLIFQGQQFLHRWQCWSPVNKSEWSESGHKQQCLVLSHNRAGLTHPCLQIGCESALVFSESHPLAFQWFFLSPMMFNISNFCKIVKYIFYNVNFSFLLFCL